MQKTYTLSIAGDYALVDLALPLMTLAQAEQARDKLAFYGKTVLVRNKGAI